MFTIRHLCVSTRHKAFSLLRSEKQQLHKKYITGRLHVGFSTSGRFPHCEKPEFVQLDNAELYIRIANARDADGQSIHTIQPTNAVFYKYPPLKCYEFNLRLKRTLYSPEIYVYRDKEKNVAVCPLFQPDSLHPSSYETLYRYATPPQITPGFGDNVDPPPPAEIMMSH